MVRERVVDVVIPVVPDSGGNGNGNGIGVVAAMAAMFAAVVVFAAVVCVVVACTDFGPGSTIPTGGGCAPFCTATVTATPGAGVAR
ncbi:hypothetical protein U3653_22990 [Nocardia sp. CDC186]|uniref:Uncharacterized protein n=1 Tax=Nocardia implantans TaxID=3108168 RepID=A0ABU6AZV3_9NOCA|nr:MULTISPECIES: hypothetical protein [unclassified Nocardia]MBF6191333.1 hypothetical protein [Nocardia beijingensis]MEA3532974.1 hypothetical protein [Nocardia sp. CDC192]MEB3512906.1 hypothetical protein [Nocardia sp. CDC186]